MIIFEVIIQTIMMLFIFVNAIISALFDAAEAVVNQIFK